MSTMTPPAPSVAAPAPAIGEYAVIGNCRAAALVSASGSIDWLCLPRFDSPSVFGAILDWHKGGRFSLAPAGSFTSTRRYAGQSNVLETTFRTQTGQVTVTDVMPVSSERHMRDGLWPDHELIRRVDAIDGEVEMEIFFDPRPDYGRTRPRTSCCGKMGLLAEAGRQTLILRGPDEALNQLGNGPARFKIRAGERIHFSMAASTRAPSVLPSQGGVADGRIELTQKWWQQWVSKCTYDGPRPDLIRRSALVLKLLCYGPSGAVIAAPTTSLPERIGGDRNWDYRYCWLRDASITARALFELGLADEAACFTSWILQATQITRPRLGILYDVYGEHRLPESTLDNLEGYRGSRPVRIGNGAINQLQLDVYGTVADAAYQFTRRGGTLDRASASLLLGIGETACELWDQPDEGIWEPRSGRSHHTLSKAMCWVALDRLLTLHKQNHLSVPLARFQRTADAIRRRIDKDGFSRPLGTFVSSFGSEQVDASLLLLSLYGFEDARSPRMQATATRIDQELGPPPLLHRYKNVNDGLRGGEGAFGVCCFWAVEQLALAGRISEAKDRFEQLCTYANDLGLFSEEIDPATGALLGNFPQAFTHVGLITTAKTIARAQAGVPESHTEPTATGHTA